MGLLVLIGILALIYYFAKNSNDQAVARKSQAEEALLRRRNREWVGFIIGYRAVVKTEAEKKLITRMLDDIRDQGLATTNEVDWLASNQTAAADAAGNKRAPAAISQEMASTMPAASGERQVLREVPPAKDAQAVRLDNISLLLYFGAFLFVAAVGLFVAFAGASGWIRTLAVLFVTLALYATGHWVYRSKPALKPAGLAFVGMGVAIAPLVGVAAYSYISGTSPQAVWFATSLFCLALYGHALLSLRKPLINYIFIFTLLSLFESGVAILDAPIYYFGWTMAAIGLLLQVVTASRGVWPDFRESSRAASQLYIPLAVLVALVIVPAQGYGQLGVSLLLAALYYGLESWRAVAAPAREALAVASHVSLLVGLISLFYSFSQNIALTGIFLAAISLAHVVVLMLWSNQSRIMQNIATVMLASTLISIIMLVEHVPALTAVLGLHILQSIFVWWRQKRSDAYVLATLGWTVLPLVFGKLALSPGLSINPLIALSIAALAAHIGLYLTLVRPRPFAGLLETARSSLLIHTAVVTATILFASPGVVIGALFVVSLALLTLSFVDKENIWEITSGIVISLAVLRCWNDVLLLAALMVALAYNILLALRFRSETNRWLSTGLWLLWPIGLGGLTTSQHWGVAAYAWAYVGVMLGLVTSRGIARGAVFPSAKIPLTAYARTASLSYVVGYIIAGGLAVWISLFAPESQWHTTGILGVISLVVFGLAWSIEKQARILAWQPLLWQLMLISGLRPAAEGSSLTVFVLLSTLLAAASYGVYRLYEGDRQAARFISSDFGQAAVLVSFIAPGSIFYAAELSWAMPVGLLVAGVLLLDHWRKFAQEYQELAVSVIVVAFMWLLYYAGVREVQAYTHILAFMFAGFAWWRHTLQDKENSDNYIYVALATATVPLLVQALSAEAGGLYGWWLLVEQVIFMLIGMATRKRFVIMWGLYVAVGSVLYQLRHLGYAALAVLAMFVIGIAVYQLQKYNKPDQ